MAPTLTTNTSFPAESREPSWIGNPLKQLKEDLNDIFQIWLA